MTRLQLAPSILTADFARIADEVAKVEDIVDWFHLDVMDGHYVPNITFGPSLVKAIDACTERPLHVHLMISDPARYADEFADAGADRISFHPEVVDDAGEVIETIRRAGAGAGIAVHPDVEVEILRPHLDVLDVVLMMTVRPGFGGQRFLEEVVPKIGSAREMVDSAGARAPIEVDGGINLETVEGAVEVGADIIVAGSAIFDGVDPASNAVRLRARLDELGGDR